MLRSYIFWKPVEIGPRILTYFATHRTLVTLRTVKAAARGVAHSIVPINNPGNIGSKCLQWSTPKLIPNKEKANGDHIKAALNLNFQSQHSDAVIGHLAHQGWFRALAFSAPMRKKTSEKMC